MSPSPVEPLETRRLFAAIALRDKMLQVSGTPGVPNTITVGLSPDLSDVVATVAWQTGRGANAKPHVDTESFPVTDDISLVRIVGSSRADAITISQTYSSFPIATEIFAGGGNDTVLGGDEPDLVYGQGGNDSINGGAGDDSLYGQAGNDTLIGGAGDDFLSGRRGRDSLEGDAGDDTLLDPFGPDTLVGGAGTDTFELHTLSVDTTDYVAGNDTLHIVALPNRQADNSPSGLSGLLGSLFPIGSIF